MSCVGVILAAGEGTRMKSKLPKVLHKAAGMPLVKWVIDATQQATGQKPILVCGNHRELVEEYCGDLVQYAFQPQRLGSGHAVMCAKEELLQTKAQYCLVLAGDMPLISASTLQKLVDTAMGEQYSGLILSGILEDATGYGRILRDETGQVVAIVEHKDATAQQREIREINSSIYCFRVEDLCGALDQIRPNNAQGEYYLTDVIQILYRQGKKTGALPVEDQEECMGVNDRAQLYEASQKLRQRINNMVMKSGVTLIDASSTYIDSTVRIGRDTIIYPGVVLEGNTQIGEDCILFQGSHIVDSSVGDGTVVENSVVVKSQIGKHTQIGPYAFLRPGSQIGSECRIGDFVEVKNSEIADGSKVSHLSYVGDSQVGRDVNVGCGVVFVNYDGIHKTRTTIGDGAFIGCNTNLISPVKVGDGAYIAAGATITKDVPENSLVIARAREVVKEKGALGRFHHGEHGKKK